MKRNSTKASNGRVRYVGRDLDLYFFKDVDGSLRTTKPTGLSGDVSTYKMVASTNCSFNSSATFDTIIDKSTPKSGVKQLNTIDWSFSSDNNIANLEDLKALMGAHKSGTEIYVIMAYAKSLGANNLIDSSGSSEEVAKAGDILPLVEGTCVIQSITLNAQDGSLATFSMSLEGSGDYDVDSIYNTGDTGGSGDSGGGTTPPEDDGVV